MSIMSDLHLLAGNVRDYIKTGVEKDEAISAVAEDSSYDRGDVEWAYNERFGGGA